MDILNYQILDVTVQDWLIAIGIALLIGGVLRVGSRIVAKRIDKLAARTTNRIDDLLVLILKGTKSFTLLAVGLWAALLFRQFPEQITGVVGRIAFIVLLIQMGLWGGGGGHSLVDGRIPRGKDG